MPPKKRYRAYLEPNAQSSAIPRQTIWSQLQKESAASSQACQSVTENELCGDNVEAANQKTLHEEDQVPLSQPSEQTDSSAFFNEYAGQGDPDVHEEADDPDDDLSDFIAANSTTTLPGQSTTRLQAMLLILTFVVAAKLPWTQVDSLLKLLNALLGEEVFPSTKYGFRKIWKLQQSKMVNIHAYCPMCQFLIDVHGVNHWHCGICSKVTSMAEVLKKGSFFITLNLKRQLQQLLKRLGNTVGKNLLQLASSRPDNITDVTDGLLYQKVRSDHKMKWSDLTLTLNTDGSPVFKSSKGSVWPIQVALNELPVPLRWKNILVGAVWFSKEHPPAHLFLKTFVDKFQELGGLTWTFADRVVHSAVRIVCCCVDSPARAALLNAKQYNGYYGCTWCLNKGTLVDGTVKYTFEGEAMLERCHDTVLSAMSLAAARKCSVDGVKGPSPVKKLGTLDLVWGFPPDYMHCVLEGVSSQITELWLSGTGKAWYIGNRIAEINERMLKARPPICFSRLPRPISERAFWKATEWKYWLLYYSVPCLQNMLPDKYIRHFSLLAEGIFMLLKESVEHSDTFIAERLLKQFVQEVRTLYNESAQTFNVHQLVHLAKSVRMMGPLWATSTFPFEGGNGDVLKLVSAAKGVPRQISERFIMLGVLNSLKRLVPLPPFLKKQQELISGKTTKQCNSSVLGAALPPCVYEEPIRILLRQTIGSEQSVTEYLRAHVKGFAVHSAQYQQAEKTCSCYFEAVNGKIVKILKVFAFDSKILLLCQELIIEEFQLPFLFKIEQPPLGIALCMLCEESILSPCVLIEHESTFLVKMPNHHESD